MAGKAPPRKGPPSPNGAPTLTPLGRYAGRPDIAISRQITVVGSKAGSRLHLASSTVSQSHAVIVNSASGAYIRDLASRTHVIVNGRPQREADLNDGTLLQIGKFKFQFNTGVSGAGLVEPGRSAPVGAFDPAPRALLNVEGGEMPVPIEGRSVLIGRRPTCDVPLVEDSASTAHAIIFEMNGKRFIRDLNSRTGTFVNGEQVEQAEIAYGDEIRIGETNIVYTSATGEVAEREVDELDHLVSTNLLGQAELEAPDFVPEAEGKHGTAAGHAIPVEADDSQDAEDDLIAPVVSAREPAPAREPEGPPQDQVQLDADPDVGSGPGDTRVLPAERADKPRKVPTLKAHLVEAPEPAPAEEQSVVDDALGLTPESRHREEVQAEELGGSRRGWRSMASPEVEARVPAVEPETSGEADAEAPVEPEPEAKTELTTEPATHDGDDEEDAALPVAPAAEGAEQPVAEEPIAEEPIAEEPIAAAASAEHQSVPRDVLVGEDTDTVAASVELPADTFDITEDVSAPLGAQGQPDIDDELHLPPVIDDTVDDLDIEPLPLTPEQGAPLDLTLEEPPVDIDAPTPTLQLEEPEPVEPPTLAADTFDESLPPPAEPAAELESLGVVSESRTDAEPVARGLPPEVEDLAAPEPVAEVSPVVEPEKKPKRKRAPRKKKGAAADPVVEAPVEVPTQKPAESGRNSRRSRTKGDAPAPVAAIVPPAADSPRDDVEVLDDTQPTPESAQAIEDLAADVLSAPPSLDDPMIVSSEASAMTDTGFGRAVDSFIGESTGPLVESREEKPVPPATVEPQPEPVAQAVTEPEDEIELVSAAPAEVVSATPSHDEAAAADELAALQIEPEAEAEVRATADAAAAEESAALQVEPLDATADASIEIPADDESTAANALAELSAVKPGEEDVQAKSDVAPSDPEELAAAALADLASADSIEPAHDARAATPSIDDLLEDVLGPADDQKAEPAALSADDTHVDMDALSLEEPASAAEAETMPAASDEEQEPEKLELAEPLATARTEEPESTEPPKPQGDIPPSTTPQAASGMSPMSFGPNQEHFLGGMPLKLNKPAQPSRETTGPGAAAARAPGQPQGRTPFMPPPPPRATRPNARTRNPFEVTPNDVPAGADLGASIPPYSGNNAKSGMVTTGFDGLAMPPVRQTDVFSQMPATPNAFAAGLAGGLIDDNDDIFSRGAKVAQSQPPASRRSPAAKAPHEQDAAAADEVCETIENAAATAAADAAAAVPAEPAHEVVHEPSPADAVWADAHADDADDEHEEQPVGAATEPTRPARALPTPPSFPGAEPPATPAPKKKRRWFGLRMLLLLMLLLGGAAAGGIYQFVKKQTEVVGRLRFDNVDALKTIEQQNLLADQKKLVGDHRLRDAAAATLPQVRPGLAPGFLGDAVEYERFARTADWSPQQKGAFAVTYSGNDPAGDRDRVRAVMLALYEANATRAANNGTGKGGSPTTIRETVETLTAAHTKAQQRVNDLKAQIDQLNIKAQQMPERKQLDALSAEVVQLDKTYTDARRTSKNLSDDLERMRQSMPANPQPAGTAQVPIVDEGLTKLLAELEETNKKLDAAKADRAKGAEAAQAALDAALAQFEKGIAGAQGLAQDNPELAAYVTAAQKLQTSTRELTQQLIRRQQQQQQQLSELMQRLSDKRDARRADTWKKDPKLQEYGDQLDIVQRQYNAAVGGGATKEAEEFKSHMDLLQGMIKARQDQIGDDAFYADAITQLEKMIDSSKRSLEGDRKQTEAVLEEMQTAFTRSQPTVEKMSGAQKELAASLEKQLADVNAARKQYTQAADAASAAGDDENKAAATALAAKIEARRKDLSAQADKAATAEQEQARVAQLKQRETELVSAQSAELTAQKDWEAAQKKLREAQLVEAAAREAGEQRDAKATERVAAQKELEQILAQLELKQQIARSTVEPIAPTENDVQMTIHDPRPVYALASVGGIVAVFTLLALFTAGGGDDRREEMPVADLSPFDSRPMPTPMPRTNGNGAASHQPTDEDAPRVAV